MWVQQRGEQSELGETTVSEAQSKFHVLPNVHCVEEPLEAGKNIKKTTANFFELSFEL